MAVETLLASSFILRSVSAALVVYVLVQLLTKINNFVKKFRFFQALPGETSYSFLYGNLHKLPRKGEERIKYGRKRMEENPKFNRAWAGPFTPMIVLHHPETVKQVLKSSAPKSRGFGTAYEMAAPWIGEGLISSNGQTWARARRLLTPAFHFDILKTYIEVFNQAADKLIEKLDVHAEVGDKFDMCPLLTLCTLEVILKCAMSYEADVQGMEKHPYAQAAQELVDTWSDRGRTVYLWPDFIFRMTEAGRRFYKNCDYVHKVAEEIIEKRKKAMEKEGIPKSRRMDFLDLLLTARDEDGKPMTDLEIRYQVDTFMFAGHDTTATGAPWILYCLATNPDYQKQVQEELDQVLEGKDEIEWSDLPKLQKLGLCIKESFRLYPPVPVVQRELNEDIEIDGHVIPSGTLAMILFQQMHRNPAVWEKPDEFIPERFSKESTAERDNFAYTPFSAGSRNCIGQNFAVSEEKVVIGRILRQYTVEFAKDGPPAEREPGAVLRASNGLWFRLKKRYV